MDRVVHPAGDALVDGDARGGRSSCPSATPPTACASGADGRLYVASTYAHCVSVVDGGEIVDRLVCGDGMPTNCCFGGTDLYVTESRRGTIWRFPLGVEGLPLRRSAMTADDHPRRPTPRSGIDPPTSPAGSPSHVADARPPLRFSRVAGGHSCLTYIVTDADGRRFVLRRPPMGHVLATAHDVAREHRVMAALQDSGVPVPTMVGAERRRRRQRRAVLRDGPRRGRRAPRPRRRHRRCCPTTRPAAGPARRSSTPWSRCMPSTPTEVGLGDLSKGSGYVARQLRAVVAAVGGGGDPGPARDAAAARLARGPPAGRRARPRIVHGDFRLGNAIHRPDGSVAAVLDWELCALGDPMADVSYLLRSWGPPTGGDGDGQRRCGTGTHASLAPGFPSRDELIDRYERGSGRPVDDLAFWIAFHCWRSTSITEGVYRRYIDGAMANTDEDADRYRQIVDTLIVGDEPPPASADPGIIPANSCTRTSHFVSFWYESSQSASVSARR